MGSVQTTLYHAEDEAAPVEVKTQARNGETPRTFDARHLDDLEASFAAKAPKVLPAPAKSRGMLHQKVSGGIELEFPLEHRAGETAEAFGARVLHTLAKLALNSPGDT